MKDNTMRKIHVPAYCPMVRGVQVLEYSGVVCAVKNTISIWSMPIMPCDMSIMPGGGVDEGMLMPLIDMLELMSMLNFAACDQWPKEIEVDNSTYYSQSRS